jgi:hypothetical protein
MNIPYQHRSFPSFTDCTCLHWWCGRNDLTPAPLLPSLVKALPQATGYAVANAGHQPHIGNSAIVNPLVLDFLKSIAVDGGSQSR